MSFGRRSITFLAMDFANLILLLSVRSVGSIPKLSDMIDFSEIKIIVGMTFSANNFLNSKTKSSVTALVI